MWKYRGQTRPSFALEPGPGQESVWDYPRPPRIERDERRVEVRLGERFFADSHRSCRVLETASPPTFYLPPEDVARELLVAAPGSSFCEWKGAARYWAVELPDGSSEVVGWSYPTPNEAFRDLTGFYSFYPGRVECYVDGERVRPQPGEFYGGWLTSEVVGPVKGESGTGHW